MDRSTIQPTYRTSEMADVLRRKLRYSKHVIAFGVLYLLFGFFLAQSNAPSHFGITPYVAFLAGAICLYAGVRPRDRYGRVASGVAVVIVPAIRAAYLYLYLNSVVAVIAYGMLVYALVILWPHILPPYITVVDLAGHYQQYLAKVDPEGKILVKDDNTGEIIWPPKKEDAV